jgi:hypothetical protein
MEPIVEFKDQKYTWQDIEGKGKCLVPYIPPKPKFICNRGDKLDCGNGHDYRLLFDTFDKTYRIINLQINEIWQYKGATIEELLLITNGCKWKLKK